MQWQDFDVDFSNVSAIWMFLKLKSIMVDKLRSVQIYAKILRSSSFLVKLPIFNL